MCRASGTVTERILFMDNITSKQRAYLRGLSNDLEAIIHVGKASLTPEITKSVDEALEKRELVKVAVLKNCPSHNANLFHFHKRNFFHRYHLI